MIDSRTIFKKLFNLFATLLTNIDFPEWKVNISTNLLLPLLILSTHLTERSKALFRTVKPAACIFQPIENSVNNEYPLYLKNSPVKNT